MIVGAPAEFGSGVEVIASVRASGGAVVPRSQRTGVTIVDGAGREHETWRPDGFTVTVDAEEVVRVAAPTYAEALRMLGALWSPPDPPEPVRSLFGGND